ncbi:hypothetical protein ACL02O_00085 [Micromonospora sp. MS34]|uniref:hypothetical protein n=1 Tax=Micromonospora sp. MS34 TaxID=3385971 RepID=UPI0039A111A3
MPETAIKEMFAEFEAAARETFRPPGVPAAQRRVRDRRRHRRGMLAGLAALLLAGSAGGYAVAHRGDRSAPHPTPSGSPSPDGKLTEREVILPGFPGRLRDLRFVDGRAGWALLDTCPAPDPAAEGCRRTVARTTDAGATWRSTNVPEIPPGFVQLLPRDGERLTLMLDRRYLVTVDGGVTWTSHSGESPAEEILRTFSTPGGLRLGCPHATGDIRGQMCRRWQVLRFDGRPLPHQPPVTVPPDSEGALLEGADGRLWLTLVERDQLTVVTSDDRGDSWRKIPPATGARRLTVSPDGREVWLVRTDRPNRVWRLVGDRWRPGPALPDDTSQVTAVGAGALLVTSWYGGIGFVVDGRYVDIRELRDLLRDDPEQHPDIAALPDGTVQVLYRNVRLLGTGRGADRSWIAFS